MDWKKMKLLIDHFNVLPEFVVHAELKLKYYSKK